MFLKNFLLVLVFSSFFLVGCSQLSNNKIVISDFPFEGVLDSSKTYVLANDLERLNLDLDVRLQGHTFDNGSSISNVSFVEFTLGNYIRGYSKYSPVRGSFVLNSFNITVVDIDVNEKSAAFVISDISHTLSDFEIINWPTKKHVSKGDVVTVFVDNMSFELKYLDYYFDSISSDVVHVFLLDGERIELSNTYTVPFLLDGELIEMRHTHGAHFLNYFELQLYSWDEHVTSFVILPKSRKHYSFKELYGTFDVSEYDIFSIEFNNSYDLSVFGIKIGDTREEYMMKLRELSERGFGGAFSGWSSVRFSSSEEDAVVDAIFLRDDLNEYLIGDTKIGAAEDMKLSLRGGSQDLSDYELTKGIRLWFDDGVQRGMTIVVPQ